MGRNRLYSCPVGGTVAFFLRNALITNPALHISWLSFHVIGPAIFILFHAGSVSVYTAHAVLAHHFRIFKANLYAVGVIFHVCSETASHTSRLFIGFIWIFAFFFLVLFRFVSRKLLNRLHMLQLPVLIMGAGKTAAIVLKYFKDDSGLAYDFIGFLEDHKPEPEVARLMPHLGTFADAEAVIDQTGVQHVLVIAPGLSNDKVQDIIYRLQPKVKNIAFIPDMGTMPLATLDMETLIDGHIVAFQIRNNMARRYNRIIKRLFDIVCACIGIICLEPCILAISLWIYKDSPGPIIFTPPRRLPQRNSTAACASMLMSGLCSEPCQTGFAKKWEKEFKLKDDPRITRSGAFSANQPDELPAHRFTTS